MKLIPTLMLLLISYTLFGQDNFGRQLNQIIKDTANHFNKFKGTVRDSSDTELIYYNSIMALEDTKDNLITIHRLICSYDATIADSTTKNKGKKILDTWKVKLMAVLGTEFKMARGKPQLGIQFIDGWHFSKDNFSVYVGLSQYFYDKSLYGVRLFISNQHHTFR